MDELDSIRQQVADAKDHLRDLLRAPYLGMSPWAITQACIYLKHPTRRESVEGPCICGRNKQGDPS